MSAREIEEDGEGLTRKESDAIDFGVWLTFSETVPTEPDR